MVNDGQGNWSPFIKYSSEIYFALYLIDCHYRLSYNEGKIDCNTGWGVYYIYLRYIINIFPCLLLPSPSCDIHLSHCGSSLLFSTYI